MAGRYLRFGDYKRIQIKGHNELSFNKFNPEMEMDADGNFISLPPPSVKLNRAEVFRLLQPYVSVRFIELWILMCRVEALYTLPH